MWRECTRTQVICMNDYLDEMHKIAHNYLSLYTYLCHRGYILCIAHPSTHSQMHRQCSSLVWGNNLWSTQHLQHHHVIRYNSHQLVPVTQTIASLSAHVEPQAFAPWSSQRPSVRHTGEPQQGQNSCLWLSSILAGEMTGEAITGSQSTTKLPPPNCSTLSQCSSLVE